MTDPVHEQLLDYLLHALDDSEQASIEARLKTDSQLRLQLEQVRRQLAPLERLREDANPPEGLADRTCRLIFAQRAMPLINNPVGGRKKMSPELEPPTRSSRANWLDLTMAAGVFFAAALVTVPAIEHSRFYARRAACENKLRQLGVAMTGFSERHQGYFPRIPMKGELATAGIYAPTLLDEGYLTQASEVICPDSALAEQRDYRIPSLAEIRTASDTQLNALHKRMGGSYGYNLGHMDDGQYRGTKNERRSQFALMSDTPSNSPHHQSFNHDSHGQNVLFEDGRVQFLHSPQPSNSSDNFFCNDIGKVAAGLHRGDSVIGASNSSPIVYVSQ